MIGSAVGRRAATRQRITACAQELAIRHGFDGFTLDDLADQVGLSRRTLFNYFDGKLQAVLGRPDPLPADLLATFLQGGPTGSLLRDIAELAATLLEPEHTTREDWHRMHQLLQTNPRLCGAANASFESVVSEIRANVEARECLAPGCTRSRLAVTVVAAVFQDSLTQFVEGDDRTLPEIFLRGVDDVTALLN